MSVYNDRTYRKRRAALIARGRANNEPCWQCGEPIDYDAPAGDRMAAEADHVEPLATGGKLLGELKLIHRHCNGRRGKGNPRAIVRRPRTSRNWLA